MGKSKRKRTVCVWEHSGSWSLYYVGCLGRVRVMGSMDNYKFTYCPFCGKKIKEKKE